MKAQPFAQTKRELIASGPTFFERLAQKVVFHVLRRCQEGRLEFSLPDGTKAVFGDGAPTLRIKLNNYRIFPRVLAHGGIGLGESFVDRDWETDDLAGVLAFFLNNTKHVDESSFNLIWPLRWWSRFDHWRKRNSVQGSKKNILAHYDLSNHFFATFLDPSLTYSSAVFENADDSLEVAQRNKIRRILDKARIQPGNSILEIGSGWGTLAIEAARNYGCRVTGLSVSSAQVAKSRERIQAAGLNDKIKILEVDYRQATGSFDRIVSVEMMEAVGPEYLNTFFRVCEERLAPNGVAVLQVITFPDQWYKKYLKRQDWIQKYIFPGSHLPSLSAMLDAIKAKTALVVESIENIAPHYARTLHLWGQRCKEQSAKISGLGFDQRFMRLWDYYLSSCEAEFATRWLAVYQIVLTRPNNPVFNTIGLDSSPQLRSGLLRAA